MPRYEDVVQALKPKKPVVAMSLVIKCPHCNEPFPITVNLVEMALSVQFPYSKEDMAKNALIQRARRKGIV